MLNYLAQSPPPVLRVFPPFRRGSNDPREAISHSPKWPATTYADVRLIPVKRPSCDRTRNFLIKTGIERDYAHSMAALCQYKYFWLQLICVI